MLQWAQSCCAQAWTARRDGEYYTSHLTESPQPSMRGRCDQGQTRGTRVFCVVVVREDRIIPLHNAVTVHHVGESLDG